MTTILTADNSTRTETSLINWTAGATPESATNFSSRVCGSETTHRRPLRRETAGMDFRKASEFGLLIKCPIQHPGETPGASINLSAWLKQKQHGGASPVDNY